MRKQGTVLRWDAQKGFGFIRSPDTVAEVFFHVRDYGENRHPVEGMVVTFDEIHVGGKGPRALKVEPLRNTIEEARSLPEDPNAVILPRSAPAARSSPPPKTQREIRLFWATMGLMALWLLLWIAAIALGRAPAVAVLTSLSILNLVTIYLYMRDKNAAEEGSWRISENQFHALALLGGWPGAWFAQRVFHHKTRKSSFQIGYWTTVALHLAGLLIWLIWPALHPAPAG
jgi:uncharacterized membrane protein YsdA (DUF1294 family)/cold shock CspA family protein